ncbi:MAG: DUF1080 domain-containing protein [Planctomycetia bacterium]|nr:DUF1080 domain-containing protein [Planctomycetia bacterium]
MTRFLITFTIFSLVLASSVFSEEAKETDQGVTELSQQEKEEGFVMVFNGKNLDGWRGDTKGYIPENDCLVCKPGGNLYLPKDYSNFIFRFEFKLTPGANNGVGIRCTPGKNAAYHGMEIQILDNYAEVYKDLKPYQFHGSIYGVVPAKKGATKPAGEWNTEEIYAKDGRIKVTVNGQVIVDADIWEIEETMDGQEHPGLKNKSGAIGFLGHGDQLRFRNIRIKELD